MKELYFSPQSIDAKSLEMRQATREIRRGERFAYSPRRSALLILDMQLYFLDPSSHAFIPSARTILPRLCDLAGAYAARNLPVIYTRHVNMPENAQLMGVWWRELVSRDNPLSQVAPEFEPVQGMVIEKTQYDAFYQSGLEELLHSTDVSQVVIGGVMTHLCCETTARSAFVHGFEVFFLVDGTATYTEAHHNASLTNLAHGFAELRLVREISDCLKDVDFHE